MTSKQRYRQQLRDPRWQRRRLEIFERDNWTCQKCHARDRELHVHHRWYEDTQPWMVPDKALITLCHNCHKGIQTMQNISTVIQLRQMSLDQTIIPTCIANYRLPYMGRASLVRLIAQQIHKDPETLWAFYLGKEGGNDFRNNLARDLSGKYPDVVNVQQLIEFESEGIIWILRMFATHFVARYVPRYEFDIYKHFDESSDQKSSAVTVLHPMELIAQQAEYVAMVARKTMELEQRQQQAELIQGQHTVELTQHKSHLATLDSEFNMFQGRVNGRIEDLEDVVTNIALAQEQAPLPSMYIPWFSIFDSSAVPTNKPRLKNSPRGRFFDLCKQVAKELGYGHCEERIRLGNTYPTRFWHEAILQEAKFRWDQEYPTLFRFSA